MSISYQLYQTVSNPNTLDGLEYSLEELTEDVRDLETTTGIISGQYIRKDGTVAMESSLNLNSNDVTSVGGIVGSVAHEIQFNSGDLSIGTSDIGDQISFRISKNDITPELVITNNTITTDADLDMASHNISNVATLTATSIGGTLTTASQPNITSVGTLDSLIVGGDLTINGTTTYLNTTNLEVEDNLTLLASNNPADILDIGVIGKYNDGVDKYCGIFRDATDSQFYIYNEITSLPGTTVTTGSLAPLNVSSLVASSLTSPQNHTIEFNVGDLLIGTGSISDQISFRIAESDANPEITITNGAVSIDGDITVESGHDIDMNGNNITSCNQLQVSNTSTLDAGISITKGDTANTSFMRFNNSNGDIIGYFYRNTSQGINMDVYNRYIQQINATDRWEVNSSQNLSYQNLNLNGNDIESVNSLTATSIGGTLTTASQPNITSVGTLTGLTMGGDIDVGTFDVTNIDLVSAGRGLISNVSPGTSALILQKQDTNSEAFIQFNDQAGTTISRIERVAPGLSVKWNTNTQLSLQIFNNDILSITSSGINAHNSDLSNVATLTTETITSTTSDINISKDLNLGSNELIIGTHTIRDTLFGSLLHLELDGLEGVLLSTNGGSCYIRDTSGVAAQFNSSTSFLYSDLNCDGVLTMSQSSTGTPLHVFKNTGTGSLGLRLETTAGGSDPYLNFYTNNTQEFSLGLDNSSNTFKLTEGSTGVSVGSVITEMSTSGINFNYDLNMNSNDITACNSLSTEILTSTTGEIEVSKDLNLGTTAAITTTTIQAPAFNDLYLYAATSAYDILFNGDINLQQRDILNATNINGDGQLTMSGSSSGTFTHHFANTGTGSTRVLIETAAGGSDSYIEWYTNNSQQFCLGLDNSSNTFKLTEGSSGVSVGSVISEMSTAGIKFYYDIDMTTDDITNIGTLSCGDFIASSGTNWYGGYMTGNGGTDVVVIGNLSSEATVGGHNAARNAWSLLKLNRDGSGVGVGQPASFQNNRGDLNAERIFDDGSQLTCYPFQQYFEGNVDLDYWDSRVPDREISYDPLTKTKAHTEKRIHFGAHKFVEKVNSQYNPLDIDSYWKHIEDKRHLPALMNRDNWTEETRYSLGELTQRLWETVECQAVHIHNLNERLKALEA